MMPEWIQTDDGSYTLFHSQFGETYHSKSGAWSECLNVFVQPFINSNSHYRKPSWRILDVGHGLGLNWLAFINLYLHRNTPLFSTNDEQQDHTHNNHSLQMVSLEIDPQIVSVPLDKSRLGNFPVQDQSLKLHQDFRTHKELSLEDIHCELLLEDIRDGLNQLIASGQKFDLVLFDAFSPKRNPECWQFEVFEKVSRCCESGAMLLSFSVASDVRRHLSQLGFEVDKQKGFGHKREKLVATFKSF